jgi:diketogulonate reductase-like aldo/keto reductase
MEIRHPTRRSVLAGGAALAATALASPLRAQTPQVLTRAIPSSGESIPAIGLGTWITFNVGYDPVLADECAAVMAALFKGGGRMIDSSPMYGSSQPVIGYGLKRLGAPPVFAADKVWTSSGSAGPGQIEQSRRYWGVTKFDLLQVHNLLAWRVHLKTLYAMKEAGRVRYVGITTSEGRRHDLFEQVMRAEPLDFVQFTYNIVDREAEQRLLPLARDRGMAVIVNRPFRQGDLTSALADKPLPDWAGGIGAASWAQFILKFILSHPAVTVAIPATSRVDHARENVAAATGPLPDEKLRQRMAGYVREL